jgi:rhodanese-related sulfurtransferase
MAESAIHRVSPREAYALLERDPRARLIDVRSTVEFQYVGHPLGAIHIAWKEFPDWNENPEFAKAVAAALGEEAKDAPVLLICRSGARSLNAAERLRQHGYQDLYNVEEGFEGDKDAAAHRGNLNGWRFHGLPWEQG